jgi:hypothetical protein
MKIIAIGVGSVGGFGAVVALLLGSTGCGTYQDLRPEAQSVTATTSRPTGKCSSLGSLTGKGGGASGGYVANESLVEYAVNDLRNQAAKRGATHVVYSSPSMGGTQGTTTSAMVMGEALRCEGGEEPSAPARPVALAKRAGCEYDTQCKGDRVCVNGKCVVDEASSTPKPSVAADAAPAPPDPAADADPAKRP